MSAYELPVDEVALYARMSPDRIACHEYANGERWTYAALHQRVDQAAAWLDATLADGARVAWLGRNSVAMLIAHLACSRSGRIFVPLNWRLAAQELANIFEDCTPELILGDGEFDELLSAALTRCKAGALRAHEAGSVSGVVLPRPDVETPSLLLYTSGTTGRPKGVIHSERSIHFGATNVIAPMMLDTRTRFLCDAPLFHVIGLSVICRATLKSGGTILLASGFDPEITTTRLQNATHYFAVPQMLDQLRLHPGFAESDLSGLTAVGVGGAPISAHLLKVWIDRGIPMTNGYGMSEAGAIALMPVADPNVQRDHLGSCGKPLAATTLSIRDVEGAEAPTGTAGELWVRGPHVTSGYWQRPEETAAAFAEGWMRTGDIAVVDDAGFYTILDRRKDMFISGGENVYPAEVEAAIARLAGVRDVAVIGVDDTRWGEVGYAFVVGEVDQSSVVAHCAGVLARYKIPRDVAVVDAIPRNASGKALKTTLREWAADRQSNLLMTERG
jgi:fatty-acyl-CoA synthase